MRGDKGPRGVRGATLRVTMWARLRRKPPPPPDSGGEEEPFSYFDSFFQESRGWARVVAAVLLALYVLALVL